MSVNTLFMAALQAIISATHEHVCIHSLATATSNH